MPRPKKENFAAVAADVRNDWNTKLLTLTGDNWEIWAIQIFPDAPPEFDSEIERRHWAQQHIISATELKEQLEMSYGNPNDPRIDKNPRVSRVRWLPKLQLARDARLIHQHIGREQQMNTYARQLASATQRVGKKAKEIANILNAIKQHMTVYTALMLKKQPDFIDAILKVFEWIRFSDGMITISVRDSIEKPLFEVLTHFKTVLKTPATRNFATAFEELKKRFMTATRHMSEMETMTLIDDPMPN